MNKRLFYATLVFVIIVLLLNTLKNISNERNGKKTINSKGITGKKEYYIPHDDINAPEIHEKTHVAEEKNANKINKRKKYKLIVIIDDFGYGHERKYNFFNRLKGYKLTCSIIPTAYNAKRAQKNAVTAGFKVMLHLPMQARNMYNKTEHAVRVDMTHDDIIKILEDDLKIIDKAGGVNNHMGSRATADRKTMLTVLKYLKDKDMFFVDSLTTSKSVVKDTCKILEIPYFRRDVFLDNEGNYAYIKKQFEKAMRIAKKRGYAIAIGHVRKATVDFFEKYLPHLDKNYELEFMEDFYKDTLKTLKNKKNKR